jgi:MFS family permease
MPPDERRLAHWLALNRTVAIVLLSVLLFGLGQQLWQPFVPLYLQAGTKDMATSARVVGEVHPAALWLVGLYAFAFNLFEAFCSFSGSHLTARLGDRASLLLFGALTILGYLLFLLVPGAVVAVAATLLILAWEPLSVPVTFTTVGATVAQHQQGMAFALQSIQKRLPKILGPLIAGFVLQHMEDRLGRDDGTVAGMRWLVASALVLSVGMLAAQWRWLPQRAAPPQRTAWGDVYRQMPPRIRRLLLAEIFTRWCDWLTRELVVLYLVFVRDVPVRDVGLYIALNHFTALVTYLPIGRLTQTVGLQPFIGWSFVFFAVFPLTLVLLPNEALFVAFVVFGLREIGEPARKALITSSLPAAVRAQGVGMYWGLRSLAICSAPLAGAALWLALDADAVMLAACALGAIGAAIYFAWCRAEPAG